ncbi:integrase core domain-containing protein [Streptomyces sp. NBC_01236]|uniref:integrase core domain-containing protein n=1 Tax=Streptomyces sp. NBC_01236 TaxID=2903789 RepID=UPI002E0EBAB9|nr:integrase core domain-containing protein [Streptomyces sp. NBC_01236]
MGRVGSCFDNAVSEAFNSILKVEYVHRHAFATRTQARIRIATWITDFYNARRLHSMCGFKSPIDYEHDYWARLSEGLAAQEGLRDSTGLGHGPRSRLVRSSGSRWHEGQRCREAINAVWNRITILYRLRPWPRLLG